jgi:hypothetical protein
MIDRRRRLEQRELEKVKKKEILLAERATNMRYQDI